MLRVMIMSYDAQRTLAANDQLVVCSGWVGWAALHSGVAAIREPAVFRVF
jgi:hypothetical protein